MVGRKVCAPVVAINDVENKRFFLANLTKWFAKILVHKVNVDNKHTHTHIHKMQII